MYQIELLELVMVLCVNLLVQNKLEYFLKCLRMFILFAVIKWQCIFLFP